VRVVSVLPSATEIVCALGSERSLVGRSEECDFPPTVRKLPVVMRARTLDAQRPSAEIDARVRASIARDESLYELDLPLLAELRPDLLLTQDLCRVCSVTDAEVAGACATAGVAPRLVSISPRRIADVWDSIEIIGRALGEAAAGERLAESLRRRTPEGPAGRRPRVAVLEWLDPPIESGLWTPELIASAGGEAWSAASGGPAVRTTWQALEARPPDLTIVSPCAFDVHRTTEELRRGPLGTRLRAWRNPGGVWVADESYFSRPGPRLAEGRDLVADLLMGRNPADPTLVVPWAPATGRAS